MQKAIFLLLPLSVCCLSCNRRALNLDVDIQIDIEQSLQDEVRVMSAVGHKPGVRNPVETRVELRNTGDTEARLLCAGTWLDDRNNHYGGSRSVVVLRPNETHKLEAVTSSEGATTFALAVTRTELTPDELLTSTLVDGTQLADGYGFTYTETPNADAIPTWALRGLANGEPFRAQTLIFSPRSSQWTLQIIDYPVDPLRGLALAKQEHPGLQVINIDLPGEPVRGAIFEKPLSFGGGYFQIKTSPGSRETTSWNTDNAWVIEFTEWERKPWIEDGGTFQQAGTASGRLYVSFKGTDHGIANSFVSGVFENAAIIYYGNPD